MAKELFITDNKKALSQTELFFPRTVLSRKDLSTIAPEAYADVILDGKDVELLDRFTKAKKWYLPKGLDFNGDLDIMNKSFVGGRKLYETPTPKAPTIEDDFSGGDLSVNAPTLDDNFDSDLDEEISMADQIAILQPLLDGKKIGEGTVAELSMKVVDVCKHNGLFERDVITGLFRTCFSKKPLISAERAEMIF